MSVEFKRNFEIADIKTDLMDSRLKSLERQLSEEVRKLVKNAIGGKNADGTTMAPLTEQYRRAKQFATGRSGPDMIGFKYKRRDGAPSVRKKSQGTGGDMLRSIQSKVQQIGPIIVGTIYSTGEQAAKIHGNNKKRKFFAWSREALIRLTEAIRNPK